MALVDLIRELQSNKNLDTYDEAATKQAIVLRILSSLGWDTYNVNEVYPEFNVKMKDGFKRVDYALRDNNLNKVFIEVKKVSEDLDKHQDQLLEYSFGAGVMSAILTNGISWWFYLPLSEGSWEQRKYYTIEIYDQQPESIAQNFEEFLLHDKVISGEAVKLAEKRHQNRQRSTVIKKAMPLAWHKLISDDDENLLELLAENTEKICGYKPDYETVSAFLGSLTLKGKIDVPGPSRPVIHSTLNRSFTGEKIVSFTFEGKTYKTNRWINLLFEISVILSKRHGSDFEKALNLRGRKNPYFSKNQNELRKYRKIPNSDIYLETNISANQIVRNTKKLLALFSYPESEISIKTK